MKKSFYAPSLCVGVALALAIPTSTPAGADDAYVCDGGRLVYARPETLEKLKQTDPCIAGYFNPKAAPAKAAPEPAGPAAPLRGVIREDDKNKPARGKSAALRGEDGVLPAPVASIGTDFRNVWVINGSADNVQIFRHER